MEFTYAAYEKLISKLDDNNYSICSYDNYKMQSKCAILRHDIDFSLEKALELAKLENRLNVKSVYFVLITSDFYNIMSKESKEIILAINDMGHEVGLHFDETVYNDAAGFENAIYNEKKIIELALGLEIKYVSMHRPSKKTLEADYKFKGLINTYNNEFFKGFKYVSDSRMHWREDIDQIIDIGNYNKLHILTHAFWYNNDPRSLKGSILDFVNSGNDERMKTMKLNITDLEGILHE